MPPAADEVEISLFGPGVGESIVAHVGNGDWIVVDSCLTPNSREPVALTYLRSIGVEPASSVRLIIATHFHDDHVRGLAAIVEACPQARFVCSAALRTTEFIQLLEANKRLDVGESNTREFENILRLMERRTELRGHKVSPEWAVEGTVLFQRPDGTLSSELRAVSPSGATVTSAHIRIGEMLPKPDSPKKSMGEMDANELSLAAWIRVGEIGVLLGADLIAECPTDRGWAAVIASPVRPPGRASIFKIPHHGSPTAQHEGVWGELLGANPVAMVAPFARGVRRLPAQSDLEWLRDRTDSVYVTSYGLAKAPRARQSTVERAARNTAKERVAIGTDMGHVRVRVLPTGKITTEILESAYQFRAARN